jgi:hypothetical protein
MVSLNIATTEPHSHPIVSTSGCLTVCNRTLLHYLPQIAKLPPIITLS